jgi:anti-sigma regulatory factor (Ser/Thr protein kinase)
MDDKSRWVRTTVPLAPEFGRVARRTATALAWQLDFPYDRLKDMELAVGELFELLAACAEGQNRCELALAFEVRDSSIAVNMRPTSPCIPIRALAQQQAELDALSPLAVAAAVADDLAICSDQHGGTWLRLVVNREAPGAGC